MNQQLPTHLHKILSAATWAAWSVEQQAYILKFEGQPVLGKSFYAGKKWELDRHRPTFGEICPKCYFEFCFYAEPRNYSLGDADVMNLMKCANVTCQHEFESKM
ncbi:MAG: hypothetical protein JNL09_04380 [Anaerolineales bacterium]|nr:hypothetical protein [Anaerolineales bacterium]